MSFFKKLKAKLGTGSAKVEIKLDKTEFKRGETVTGQIKLIGGEIEQEVLGIFIDLGTQKNSRTIKFGDYKVFGNFKMNVNEKREIPFTIDLPLDGPFTKENEIIYLMLSVSVDWGADVRDRKFIRVEE